ncbi:hypothetical protein [Legionella sp. WA2022007384]
MYNSKIYEQEPRVMWIAGQNETIRKTAMQNGFPATVGLEGCVAIIFADKKGNVSLTHVDTDTDLSFIKREVAFMDGPFTIDLIKKTGKGDLDLKIIMFLDDAGLSKIPSSNPNRVAENDEGTVVYNYLKKVPQCFSFNDFKELAIPGITPRETNKLLTLGYSVQTCIADPLRFQLRIYSRQLNQALSTKAITLPLLVHDASGWLQTEMNIDEEVEVILKGIKTYNNSFFYTNKLTSLSYVLPRYLSLKDRLESLENKLSYDGQ